MGRLGNEQERLSQRLQSVPIYTKNYLLMKGILPQKCF